MSFSARNAQASTLLNPQQSLESFPGAIDRICCECWNTNKYLAKPWVKSLVVSIFVSASIASVLSGYCIIMVSPYVMLTILFVIQVEKKLIIRNSLHFLLNFSTMNQGRVFGMPLAVKKTFLSLLLLIQPQTRTVIILILQTPTIKIKKTNQNCVPALKRGPSPIY